MHKCTVLYIQNASLFIYKEINKGINNGGMDNKEINKEKSINMEINREISSLKMLCI